MLNILSSAFAVAITCVDATDSNQGSRLPSLLDKLKTGVSLICHIDMHDLYASKSSLMTECWRYFPIPSSWQTDDHSIMSRSAYNLCVGCSVSSFSGWEKDEFTLNLMKKGRKETFFGVHVQGTQVAGYVSNENEARLSTQWKVIEKLVPTLCSLDFDNAAANAKKSEWCKKSMENLESHFKDVSIACYGEDSALNVLLGFAHVALLIAEDEEDEIKSEGLLKNALSVILPVVRTSSSFVSHDIA